MEDGENLPFAMHALSAWFHSTALSLDHALAFSIGWMSKRDQRGQGICPRSHSRARFGAKPMLLALPWQKPSISPLKDPARLLSLSAWEGPGQEMEQSLAALTKGMEKGVAEGLPSSGCQPLPAPRPPP